MSSNATWSETLHTKQKIILAAGDFQPTKNKIRLFLVEVIFYHDAPKAWIEEHIFERSTQKLRKAQAVFEAEKNGYSTVMSHEVSPWQEMIGSMVVRITG